MSSYLRQAYQKLVDAGVAGTVGSLERRVVEGIATLGTFNGSTVGQLSGRGSYLRQLYEALSPPPAAASGGYLRRLGGGGWPEFISAISADSGGGSNVLQFNGQNLQLNGENLALGA